MEARFTADPADVCAKLVEAGYPMEIADEWTARLKARERWEYDSLPERIELVLFGGVTVTFFRAGSSNEYREFVVGSDRAH